MPFRFKLLNEKDHQYGFTLIEALTLISIIGIISAFAMPSFNGLLKQQHASVVAQKLYHQLQFARKTSIDKNMPITLCSSDENLQCRKSKEWAGKSLIIFIDFNGSGSIDPEDQLLSETNLGIDEGSLQWRSFGNKSYLQWFPVGMTRYQNGHFTYCPADGDEKFSKKIILNAAGRVYFGMDNNKNGIPEGADGKDAFCKNTKA